ncbi:MAG: hypothetical protein ABIE22_00480 [archaeon]
MKIVFKAPLNDMRYQAHIMETSQDGKTVYEVAVGRECTEAPDCIGDFVRFQARSGFLPLSEMDAWLLAQTKSLKEKGQQVEFIGNFSYLADSALTELALESSTGHTERSN